MEKKQGPWSGFNVGEDGYPERQDGDELFGVRGGQGRSARDVVDTASSSWFLLVGALAMVVLIGLKAGGVL